MDVTGAFFGGHGRFPGQQSGALEDAINAARAAGDDVGVEHHETQAAIAFKRVLPGKDTDPLFFVVSEPMIAWDPGVVLVDLAEALFPIVELAGADADPGHEATSRDLRFVAPIPDEIDDRVTGIVGNPGAF